MKKKFLVIFFYLASTTTVLAKVNSAALSGWYYSCMDAGYSHSYCKCNVETMNQKLTNQQFEKIFVKEQWKIADWMKENVIPICGLGER